jgi:deoxyadenosine/deoxycytidine kinase
MQITFIFGAVGAGKTTYAQQLAARHPDAILVPEPVDDNPFLPLYARDRTRWALACQAHYYLQYVRAYATATAGRTATRIFIDAGAPTNLHVYGRYLREHAIVTPDEYRLYETLTGIIAAQYAYPQPTDIISVEAPLDVCMARVQARGRDYELDGHGEDYLAALYQYTADMVAMYEAAGAKVKRVSNADNS